MLGDRFSGIQIETFSKERRIGGSGQERTMVRQDTILSTMNMVMAGLTMMDEAPILWSPDVKNQLTGKYPDAGTN